MKMTHAIWMKDTAVFAKPRSKELQAIDNALKHYDLALLNSTGSVLAEKKSLQQALAAWKASKGPHDAWKNSERNKKLKAVERLDAELGLVITGKGGLNSRGEVMIDPAELKAQKALAQMIKDNTKTLFTGQKLTLKKTKALADLNTVRTTLQTFKNSAKTIASGGTAATAPTISPQVVSLLQNVFGEASVAHVQEALGPLYTEFIASAVPFLGAITSGAKAVAKWGSAAKGLYDKSKMKGAEGAFAPGDPAAAFEAILRIQQREINANATSASIYTVSAGAKAAFAAADFGALSGPIAAAAENFALVVQKIYLFARDWNEMKAANVLLEAQVYDLSLFKSCPLLGCYLIGNSDHAAIINMAVGDYGRVGWKFEVEAMLIKARPVFDKARTVIADSRFEIAGMRDMKGGAVNRHAKALGFVPTGKIAGLLKDAEKKINAIGASA